MNSIASALSNGDATGSGLWRIDSISVMLLILTAVIALAVLPYAHRSLRGDRHGVIVTAAIALMLVATAVVSIAGPLWMLALAWTASTIATLVALGFGGGRRAVIRSAPWLIAADLALWAAVLLVALDGPVNTPLGDRVDATALLLVIAAVVRCALPPAHNWLVDSLYAPTPVSAALHGGIVNGGGILVITQFDTIVRSDVAIIALAVVAAVAVLVGALASLVRTDVKGRLVMSTVAQMGFMLLCVALGLVAAALLHLVAHGFYKSSLFLASNDGIDRRAANRRAPQPPVLATRASRVRIRLGALLPISALVVTALAVYPGGRGEAELVVLIVLAAAFGAAGSRVAALVPGGLSAAVAALAVSGLAVLYVVLTSVLTAALALPTQADALGSGIAVVIAFGVLLSLAAMAAVSRYAPASGPGLTLLAIGHRVGATRTRTRSRTDPRPAGRSVVSGIATEEQSGQRPLRVRARADRAATVVAAYYGLDAAIAVNPVLPSLEAGFAAAIQHAAPALGAFGALTEEQFRQLRQRGRISDADLALAIRRHGGISSDSAYDAESVPDAESVSGVGSDAALVGWFMSGPAVIATPVARQPSAVDELLSQWCRAALAPEAAAWPVPVRQAGFYGAWRAVARHDYALSRQARRRIAVLPVEPDQALAQLLELLGVHDDAQLAYLRGELSQLAGWTAYVNWRAMTAADVDAVQLLAVRLGLTWALGVDGTPGLGSNESHEVSELTPQTRRSLIWQEAFESQPHRAVLNKLRTDRAAPPTAAGAATGVPAEAHLVFCIDPRSEGFRRHLESRGAYATSGFAGFFGIAALIEPLSAAEASASCPVLLTPRYLMAEHPEPNAVQRAARFVTAQSVRRALRAGAKAPDGVAGAPLGWAEITGWLLGPISAARSVLAGRTRLAARPDDPTTDLPTFFDVDAGLSADAQIDTAEVIVRTMGMVNTFAPLVVFVGHGTSTTNNAFRTALDCGACGGHRGAPNARIAAAILNSPQVRIGLAARGVIIPAGTRFLAGEHDTATDRLTLADPHAVAAEHRASVQRLLADADSAGEGLAAERVRDLPGAGASASASASAGTGAAAAVANRARDWAQVYPEWGLAGNAALIIGPRSLSVDADLERRVFLHSYEAAHDAEGAALEIILTAPLVVAHWINAQYYFSSVAPDVLGAGSKTVHNLVGGVGVLIGPSGDLRLGLPWQSVGTRDGLFHEPVRLLAVVDAPRERIERIVEQADVVKQMVHGEWVILVRPTGEVGRWERCTANGWVPWMNDDTTNTTHETPTTHETHPTHEKEAA
jgi:hypothetical protein